MKLKVPAVLDPGAPLAPAPYEPPLIPASASNAAPAAPAPVVPGFTNTIGTPPPVPLPPVRLCGVPAGLPKTLMPSMHAPRVPDNP